MKNSMMKMVIAAAMMVVLHQARCADAAAAFAITGNGIILGDASSGSLVSNDQCFTTGAGKYGQSEDATITASSSGYLYGKGTFLTDSDYDRLVIGLMPYKGYYVGGSFTSSFPPTGSSLGPVAWTLTNGQSVQVDWTVSVSVAAGQIMTWHTSATSPLCSPHLTCGFTVCYRAPSASPSASPTRFPTSGSPTVAPTSFPIAALTSYPTLAPTRFPTSFAYPTVAPTSLATIRWYAGSIQGESCDEICTANVGPGTCDATGMNAVSSGAILEAVMNEIVAEQGAGAGWTCKVYGYSSANYAPRQFDRSTCFYSDTASSSTCSSKSSSYKRLCCCPAPGEVVATVCPVSVPTLAPTTSPVAGPTLAPTTSFGNNQEEAKDDSGESTGVQLTVIILLVASLASVLCLFALCVACVAWLKRKRRGSNGSNGSNLTPATSKMYAEPEFGPSVQMSTIQPSVLVGESMPAAMAQPVLASLVIGAPGAVMTKGRSSVLTTGHSMLV